MEAVSMNQIENYLPIIDKMPLGQTLEKKLKIVLSVGLFVEKEVTLARAAELAGKSIQEFIEILNLKGIPWGEYTEEHLRQDNIGISKYFEKEGLK
jgi:predicted HTH domain antitoxin